MLYQSIKFNSIATISLRNTLAGFEPGTSVPEADVISIVPRRQIHKILFYINGRQQILEIFLAFIFHEYVPSLQMYQVSNC
jgi:hypothetical protein